MLAIRMQRTGRKGHAMFRVVVQDSRRTPTSGKIVAQLGSYDPHAKTVIIDKEKAGFYLTNGAQPSERVARLLQTEGVKLPNWVTVDNSKTGTLRNVEKLRRNQPKEVKAPEAAAPVAEEEADVAEVTTEPETAPEQAPVEAESASEATEPTASAEEISSEKDAA